MNKLVHLFPGQGFQKVGMTQIYLKDHRLKDLFDSLVTRVPNLRDIMLDGPQETLNQTNYTQPAVFLHSYVAYQAHKLQANKPQTADSAFVGHSVGEFTALAAAGHLAPELAIEIVFKRAQLMKECSNSQVTSGMLVVKSSDYDTLNKEIGSQQNREYEVIALYNSHNQTVISGRKEQLLAVSASLKKKGVSCLVLPVSSAFHNPMLTPVKQQFKEFLNSKLPSQLNVPNIYCNYDCSPFGNRDATIDKLSNQLDHPVKFQQTIEQLAKMGSELKFIEYGSAVLIPFVKDILKNQFEYASV